MGMVRKPRVKKLENEMRQFACCSDFLREVLGSEGLRKLRVFETYQQALRWHFRFLDQEFVSFISLEVYLTFIAHVRNVCMQLKIQYFL